MRVDVIDTARWTVPHGDHTHSFLGEPQLRGSVDGTGEVRVTAGAQRATVHFSSGEVVELPHDDLAEVLDDAPRVTIAADGPVVSFASHLLAATAEGTVAVFDADGAPVAGGAIPCAAAADADLTRVGVVFACTEGAVLFTREVGGTIAAEPLPLPAGAAAATDLSGRADRPDLAGVAGDQGAWLLDVRTRQWTLLSSDVPLLRAVAVGDDDSRTVALDAEGRVRVLAADGTVLVRTEPLLATSVADPALLAPVQLVVDAEHAYLSDPAAGAVHEIDHTDGIVTRTFADLDPRFLSQVG
ncbi:ABC transporter [Microbacterium sp. TPD7012]|nr:ABC transporter [Microbacterium sp. TPD7012]